MCVNKKSSFCSEVLQLMDEDLTYCEALKVVLKKNPNLNKLELEEELNFYI